LGNFYNDGNSLTRAEPSNHMKRLLPITLFTLTLTLSGCAWMGRHAPWHHSASTARTGSAKSKSESQVIVTPDESIAAKVLRVNTVGRFVVLDFPEGRLPKLDQHMFLYRDGLKTAEVKIVGPQKETNIVADIISGDAQAGDTVRDQ
jgi:hypothetical protein